MRFKIIPLLFAFVIMVIASLTLYFNYRYTIIENTEIRLNNAANNIIIKIAQKPWLYQHNAEDFLYTNNDLSGGSLFVQLTDKNGAILAKTTNLKTYTLPTSKDEDDIISDITLQDDSTLKTYQKEIKIRNWSLGYVVVGMSSTQMFHNFSNLRQILAVVMICTIVILVIGLNVIFSLGFIQDQKQFLSFASHELRTPLAIITGNAEISLRQEKSPKEYQESLKIIKDEAERMGKLVHNLLYVFRNQAKKERLTLSKFNFGELITEQASAIKKRYPTKKITLILSEESSIEADPDRIAQVVSNILENAAKYTSENGQIIITLTNTNSHYKLYIQDNGRGIEKSFQKKIFKPFYRVSDHDKRGSGLGLTLSKIIIDNHHGTISVESTPGEGSIFSICLPKKP